ncbi:MAG: molybdopterin containing oxidoreductase, partial [Nitrospinaceae bacterium]|nr:molybdopterin containing oxidoreductase [Nitrospinaceae bacterium]NIR57269.1 molybdopterin containing oxidoreductase [Nitrospinaceae bacterium]NIS87717.1 molybdopterin containing oxidoreductase [Nitrospinaceae bacterium]NIT84583.1 molybdopterin containing oxidoreductase [Nitrospinaceae bacterium]NIU46769.1 molybdopterin containing oxidoreductase [Nitrospinaceae bacterium]
MPGKKERGLWELYENDPERADADLWDRTPGGMSRRGFLEKSGWALALAVGAHIP